jgi:4-hydroxy-3-methylbut-2-enyl diphosphate reductase
LAKFSQSVDAVIFVGGKKSSNSKVLFQECIKANSNSWFITSVDDLKLLDLKGFSNVGVCGATSTPQWLMSEISSVLESKYNLNV